MSIQGNSVTIRQQRSARRPSLGALSADRDEPGWMRILLVVFLITLFIPKSVALAIGSIDLTPSLACSVVLFPVLISGKRIRFAWPDAVVMLFFLSTFYSTMMSVPAVEGIESFGRRVLIGGVPFLIGRYLGTRPKLFITFMRRIMTIMAVLAVFCLVESIFRFNIHSLIWGEPYTPHKDQRLGLTRAYGWTSHSIMLGVSYAVFVPVMFIAVIERLKPLGRFRLVKLGLLLVGVFTSLSTGAWMPAVLAIGMVIWDYFHFLKPGPRWFIMFFGSFFSYVILETLSGRPLMRILMMELHLSDPTAWHYRWQLFERVYAVMPGYEWFGHGLKPPENMVNAWQWSIDNNYLVMLMQNGRVGLTLWIAVAVSVLFYGWKSIWNAPDTPYRRVARAVMFAIVTVGLTQLSVALFSTAEMLNWMFIGLGIGMAQAFARDGVQNKRSKKRPTPVRGKPLSSAQQRA